jgi:hypothetical protein
MIVKLILAYIRGNLSKKVMEYVIDQTKHQWIEKLADDTHRVYKKRRKRVKVESTEESENILAKQAADKLAAQHTMEGE